MNVEFIEKSHFTEKFINDNKVGALFTLRQNFKEDTVSSCVNNLKKKKPQ